MAEATDTGDDKVTIEAESADALPSKDEKLNRVKEKLKSMGMMPGNKDDEQKPAEHGKGRKPVLLMAMLAVIAIIIGSLSFYASDINQHAPTVAKAENKNNSAPASNSSMAGMQSEVVLPKPLPVDQVKNLQEARHFYWQREYEKSEQMYVDLIKAVKDQPDFYGELGDVQFLAGKPADAVENYYQAVLLLLDQNRDAEAGFAISVVSRFDQAKAMELMDKMASRHYSQ